MTASFLLTSWSEAVRRFQLVIIRLRRLESALTATTLDGDAGTESIASCSRLPKVSSIVWHRALFLGTRTWRIKSPSHLLNFPLEKTAYRYVTEPSSPGTKIPKHPKFQLSIRMGHRIQYTRKPTYLLLFATMETLPLMLPMELLFLLSCIQEQEHFLWDISPLQSPPEREPNMMGCVEKSCGLVTEGATYFEENFYHWWVHILAQTSPIRRGGWKSTLFCRNI